MADPSIKLEPGLGRFAMPMVNVSESAMSDTIIKVEPGLEDRSLPKCDVPEFGMEKSDTNPADFSTLDIDNNPEHLRLTCFLMIKLIRHLEVNFRKPTLGKMAEELGVPVSVVNMMCTEIQHGGKLPVTMTDHSATLENLRILQERKRLVSPQGRTSNTLRAAKFTRKAGFRTKRSLRSNESHSEVAPATLGSATAANCAPLGPAKFIPQARSADDGVGTNMKTSSEQTAAVAIDRFTNPQRAEFLLRASTSGRTDEVASRYSPFPSCDAYLNTQVDNDLRQAREALSVDVYYIM